MCRLLLELDGLCGLLSPTPILLVGLIDSLPYGWMRSIHFCKFSAAPLLYPLSEAVVLHRPGDESDFSFGVPSQQRVSLQGTIPHMQNPASATNGPRSLFASMVQSHAFWAKVAQWACYGIQDRPWLPESDFHRLHRELEEWYNGLPTRQKWSKQNLRGMLAEGKDIVSFPFPFALRVI